MALFRNFIRVRHNSPIITKADITCQHILSLSVPGGDQVHGRLNRIYFYPRVRKHEALIKR